jgi:catechol 2,3-dioxygenase-like lactoylglutathione lyase family enzyme
MLETCLYAEDLDRLARFYEELFGWKPMAGDERFRGFGVNRGSVLLLFRKGATRQDFTTPRGVIPAHDGVPGGHIGLAIAATDWEPWKRRLAELSITIESVVNWPRGGHSLYFRDPEGNLVELATPGLWDVY